MLSRRTTFMLNPLSSVSPGQSFDPFFVPPKWGMPDANMRGIRGMHNGADAATTDAVGAEYDGCCRGCFTPCAWDDEREDWHA